MTKETTDVLLDVSEERKRQDQKWGEQNHEPCFWLGIIGEEYGEACKAGIEMVEAWTETKPTEQLRVQLRHELIQVAASAVAMVEWLDRAEL